MKGTLYITGDAAADELLNTDPLALVIGMLLDQQVPMEWAFVGPYRLVERLGSLDAATIASMDPEKFVAIVKGPPALHRFPGSMAKRIQDCCRHIVEQHHGDAGDIWDGASDGADLLKRLMALPGYGEEKAKIFTAILAKRFAIKPEGWANAAKPFSDSKARRSVADIDSPETLAEVRTWKKAMKAKGKTKSD